MAGPNKVVPLEEILPPQKKLVPLDEMMRPPDVSDIVTNIPGMGYIKGAVNKISKAVSGPRDPQFKDLGRIPWEDILDYKTVPKRPDGQWTVPREEFEALAANSRKNDFSRLIKGVSQDDAQYGDIIASKMGKRVLNRQQDVNGYEVITYVDHNGKVKSGYVNLPGLDTEDLSRAGYQGGAYGLASIAAARGGFKKTPIGLMSLARTAAMQAAAAGGTSLALDKGAQWLGSDEALNYHRAMIAAGFAAGGEAANYGIGKLLQNRQILKLFKDDQLTPQGRQLMEAYGLDPDRMNKAYQQQWADDYVRGVDPTAAARRADLQSKGLEPTTAQITRHPDDILIENEALSQRFDTPSYRPSELVRQRYEQQLKNTHKSGSSQIEQQWGVVDTSPATVGDQVRKGVQGRYNAAEQAVDDQYSKVGIYRPTRGDLSDLKSRFKAMELKDPKTWSRLENLSPETTPNAISARDKLISYMRGTLKTDTPKLMGKKKLMDLESVRRELVALRSSAFKNSPVDTEAMSRVLDFYNDWLEHLATNRNLPDAVEILKARDMSAALKATYGVTGKRANDPGGVFITNLIEKGDTSAESIVDSILKKEGGLAAWNALNKVTGPGSDEVNLIKSVAFDRLFFNPENGELLPIEKIHKNIYSKLDGGKQLYTEMFNAEEQKMIQRFYRTMKNLELPDVPPGQKSAIRRTMERMYRDGPIRYIFRAKGQSARFTGEPAKAIGWHFLARTNLAAPGFALKTRAAQKLVPKMLNGKVPLKNPRIMGPMGGIGSTIGVQGEDD